MKRLLPLSHRATIITICFALLLVIGGIVGTAIGWRKILYKLQGTSHVATLDRSPGLAQFPEVNTQALSPYSPQDHPAYPSGVCRSARWYEI